MLSANKVLVIFVILVFYFTSAIKADVFDECEDVEANTYVLSSESCSTYILCNEGDSEQYDCEEGEYFDIENESCGAKDSVFCPYDSDEEADEDNDGAEGDDGAGNEDDDNNVLSTLSPITASSTISSTITLNTTPSQNLDIPPIVKDTCPATDDPTQIVYVSSNNSCSDYYVCYHGHRLDMHCTDHLHFNTRTGKCDFPENSNCKILNQPPSAINKCLSHVTDFFPHPQKCNYFYYCIKGYQTLQQCPFYYGWDIERRTCVHKTHVKCYDNTQ